MTFPHLSEKEYVALDLLRSGVEMFGLEMVKEAGGPLKRGTIYVMLNRMAEKGLVSSRQEKSPNDPGMPRRMYRITGKGAKALNVMDAAYAAASGQTVVAHG